MAKVKGGPDGSISGMIGSVVFYKVNGKSYARQAPKEREKDSWSNGQVMYRGKISKLAALWRQLTHNPIRLVWNLAAEQMSGYNLFLKTNLQAFSTDGLEIDPELLHLSVGKLPLPHKLKASKIAGDSNNIEVTWQDDSGNGLAFTDDEMMMIIINEGKFTAPIATGAIRKQQTAVVQLPTGFEKAQGIYLSFASAERMLYSPDQYFGL